MTVPSATLDHESFFHAAMATIPSSILILDERAGLLTANQNFLDKSRSTLTAIMGRKLHEIIPTAFQDTALDNQIREVIASGRTLHRQRMTYRAPGVPLRTYSYSICPLQLKSGSNGVILIMDDVTDLLRLGEEVRWMQMHLASIVESAGDLIISTDSGGTIMTWNTATEKATGFSQAEMRGCLLSNQVDASQTPDVAACFRRIHQLDERRSVEWSMKCRDGDSIPVSWHLSRMTGLDGEVTGGVIVGRNLVEQRAIEAQMHQGEKLAALGRVIGGIAHEIRNPLGVSSAAAQLMRHRMASPPLLEECVDKVIGGIDRASQIVESLLRFARPGPIMRTVPVDVYDMLKNALMFVAGETAAGTVVEWRLPERLGPVNAQGVQSLLELVAINLMLNAFQAMPDGGRLTVAYWLADEVFIEIGDNGPGIPEASLSKIFDPFFTTRNDSRRSGLGLSVCHSIVTQHGGSVSVRTSERDGTAFTVRLPVAALPDGGAH